MFSSLLSRGTCALRVRLWDAKSDVGASAMGECEPVVMDKRGLVEKVGWPWMTDRKRQLRDPAHFAASPHARPGSPLATPFLDLTQLPPRAGPRPVTHDKCPHGMLEHQSPPEMLERFKRAATEAMRAKGDVAVGATTVSIQTTFPCFHLHPSVPLPPGLIEFREFAHVHAPFVDGEGWTHAQGGGGGSTHLCVSHADASALIELGWGEWHPVAQPSMPHVMVYAPRDEGELRVALAALEASYAFVTSAKR